VGAWRHGNAHFPASWHRQISPFDHEWPRHVDVLDTLPPPTLTALRPSTAAVNPTAISRLPQAAEATET
jgi:hypothetical protein